ncbi:MAG: hypothetical protein MJY84_01695 [Bacteroidales bacterium]|nr:hypothetical protein [Bacteroidales bacterium]
MKKISIIFFAIFSVLFTSCTLDEIFEGTGQTGTTTLTFTPDFGFYGEGSDTKAFTEDPQVNNLYLAVFNEGGKALIEYVKAVPVTLATANDTKYTYTVTLKTSDKPRVIHFIANAPETLGYGSDVDAVGSLKYSFDKENWTGEDAYWGYLELSNGICDEKDARINDLKAAMSNVKLVRNFAKIKVEAATGSNLTITRFWISNFPENSTAAPYNRIARRFESGYAGYQYASDAMDAGYMGFCPAYSELVSLSGLSAAKLAQIECGPGTGREYACTYEREKPISDPLCIIVGGTSDLPGGDTETFYKIDLRDNDGNYLPVLRNFTYSLTIGTVYKVGEKTVEDALKSVSSGAIDTDLSLKDLKDLSNGKSRIAVSETERVLFDEEPFALLYSYIPDITTGTVVNKTLAQWVSEGSYVSEDAVLAAHEPYVTIEFEPGKSGKVIDSFALASYDETDGYRKIFIDPVSTSDIIKTEVITITGHVWNDTKNGYETLQRTVNYQMRPRLNMTLTLSPDRLPRKVGENITVTIGIEENLPQSLFTLDMKITTEQMSLTPGNNVLPITTELGADGKPSYFITRAITWDEYSAAPSVMDADGILRKHFDCPFKTNTSNFDEVDPSFGYGDRVLVSNENFNLADALFIVGDDNLNRFINPHLTKEYLVTGRPAAIEFGMTKLPSDGKVYVRMLGIEPVDASAFTRLPDETIESTVYAVYEFDVDNIISETFEVRTSANDVTVAYFQLFDDEFNPSKLTEIRVDKPSFTDLKFKYKNLDYVVAAKEAQATFHMDYIPQDGNVTIHLKNAVPADNSITGTSDGDGYTSYVISGITTNDVSFPVIITPASPSENTAYFKLDAGSAYNPSAVAEAPIQKLNFSNLRLINVNNTGKNYVVGGKPARIAFTMDDMPSDNVITIKLTNLTLGSGRTGVSNVQDNGDGSYSLTVTETDVTLDVTPTIGQTSAKYELSDTEFYINSLTTDIKKLNFSSLDLINLGNTTKTYLNEGKPARISFTLEDMPNDGTVKLVLTNMTPLTPLTGTGVTGITAVSGGYELAVNDKNVTLDVSVATDVTSASFMLTDAEFNDSQTTTRTVQKLEFSNVKININTGTTYLLAGDNTSTISFSVDQVPTTGKVTVWIKNASVNGGTAGTPNEDGYVPYEVSVTDFDKTVGITVNNSGFTASNNSVVFYLTSTGFVTSDEKAASVRTRYTVNWANVLIKTDNPNAAATSQSVSVYTNAACTGTAYKTFTTNGSGYASGSEFIDATTSDGSEKYYFKFTKSGVDYISDAVTLAQLASGTTVICKVQIVTYTIKARTLKFGDANGKTVTFKVGSNTSPTETITKTTGTGSGNKGYITSDFTITCTPNTHIFIAAPNGKTYDKLITEIGNRTTELTIY